MKYVKSTLIALTLLVISNIALAAQSEVAFIAVSSFSHIAKLLTLVSYIICVCLISCGLYIQGANNSTPTSMMASRRQPILLLLLGVLSSVSIFFIMINPVYFHITSTQAGTCVAISIILFMCGSYMLGTRNKKITQHPKLITAVFFILGYLFYLLPQMMITTSGPYG